jgi:hypothetical protein
MDGVENEHLRGAERVGFNRAALSTFDAGQKLSDREWAQRRVVGFRRRGCRGCVGSRQDIALRVQQPQALRCWSVS